MNAAIDEYCRIIREAGLRIGFTLRGRIYFPVDKDGEFTDWENLHHLKKRPIVDKIPERYQDTYGPEEADFLVEQLDGKITYAKKRWGATMFYIDSNNQFHRPRYAGNTWGGLFIGAGVWGELQRRHPDVLLVPEHEHFRYWAYTAPYREPPSWGGPTGGLVRRAYPRAFSVIKALKLQLPQQIKPYIRAVSRGDLLLGTGWYGRDLDTIRDIYEAAVAMAPFQLKITRNKFCYSPNSLASDPISTPDRDCAKCS